MAIPSPSNIKDIDTRNAIIALSKGNPVNTNSVKDYETRRVVQALAQGNKAPNMDAISDYEVKRILKYIDRNRS
jgi:accessory colonization factor AcfC